MKVRKIVSIALVAVITGSCFGCKDTKVSQTQESSEETVHTTVPTTSETTEPEESTTASTTESTHETTQIKDDEEGQLIVYGYDKDFPDMLKTYLPDMKIDYVYIEPKDYYKQLSSAFSDEEKKPDLFMCDKDHLQDLSHSDKSLSLSKLGIGYAELEDQFAYTYEAARDDANSVKALSYELAPSAMLYNRALAKRAFQSDEPSTVGPLLSDWDKIIDAARQINLNSEGKNKLLSGLSDIQETYWAGHTTPWVKGKKVQINADFDKYFRLEEVLFAESLTFEAKIGSEEWSTKLRNGESMMFFGSLLTAKDAIDFVYGHKEEDASASDLLEETIPTRSEGNAGQETAASETTGTEDDITGWAIVPAPYATYDGGSWLMVSSTCKRKASAAEFLRALTIDQTVLAKMALDGHFVNSRTVMKQCATDPFFACDFLGGQNPYAILVPVAESIVITEDTEADHYADKEIEKLLSAYLSREIETIDEVKLQFKVGLEELLGLS